jgi:hypothetical protein
MGSHITMNGVGAQCFWHLILAFKHPWAQGTTKGVGVYIHKLHASKFYIQNKLCNIPLTDLKVLGRYGLLRLAGTD